MLRPGILATFAVFAALIGIAFSAAEPPMKEDNPAARRQQAAKLLADGNVKEAYDLFRELVLAGGTGTEAADDLRNAANAMQRAGLPGDFDEFVEKAIAAHADDAPVLAVASKLYRDAPHFGTVIAGEFRRGDNRGRAEFVSSVERDRVRALQLIVKAIDKQQEQGNEQAAAELFMQLGETLQSNRSGGEAWRLQELTDLTTLPDYEQQQRWGWRGGWDRSAAGAPVDAEGNPIFYGIPESFEAAVSDGERSRWADAQAKRLNPGLADRIDLNFANFLRDQFDVRTLQSWSGWPRLLSQQDASKPGEPGPFALHTLSDEETIAKLATGVKRFALPEEFNFIAIYKRLAEGNGGAALPAIENLAQVYEDRRQFPKAAERWKEAIDRFGAGDNDYRSARLSQITGNWVSFETVELQPAGKPATVVLRYRNGKQVHFTAKAVRFQQLLADVKAFLSSNPRDIDWQQVNIQDIGHRLVAQNETKYLGETVATWSESLDPPQDHFDARTNFETKLSKAGVYLLTAQIEGGNTARVIVWLSDTALVRKPLADKGLYYVADATTGVAIPNAKVEFFGWRHEYRQNARPLTLTARYATTSDRNGFVTTEESQVPHRHQWLVTATTPEGRFAHLGFEGVWYQSQSDSEHRQTKAYFITDRPVYRPGQPVRFKIWARKVDYADEGPSPYADQSLTVTFQDGQGNKVYEQTLTADRSGGVEGTYELPTGATLGPYGVQITHGGNYLNTDGRFRVEEYKKPEFEVKVDAPSEPVMLGAPITAKVTAKYYFGSPVTNGTVHYKVTRSRHEARWYPIGVWDWFYGRGYWWFAPELDWYPGFARWGCLAPLPPWHWAPPEPPEIVAEDEVPVGEDGTIEIKIDTQLAKELFGDSDHRYEITAEVTDASRRTITGAGSVFAPREPFRVFSWVDRGFYRAGDAVTATFKAQTIAEKPIADGKAQVSLRRVTYDEQGTPTEKEVEAWTLRTGADGQVSQKFNAAEAGQYRIVCTVTDNAGHEIEGAYLVNVLPDRTNDADDGDYRYNALELTAEQREYRPGDTARLLLATNRPASTVLVFVRPENGLYPRPQVLKLDGKAQVVEIPIEQRDMPNLFVEALTISDGQVHSVVRELFVPPEKRIVNVDVLPSKEEYKPGENARLQVRLTDADGKPVTGDVVLTMYDRSVDYIAGGSNVPDIREFFWKWRRGHNVNTSENLRRLFGNLTKPNETGMGNIGAFGYIADDRSSVAARTDAYFMRRSGGIASGSSRALGLPAATAAPAEGAAAGDLPGPALQKEAAELFADRANHARDGEAGNAPLVEATVRSNFADTALWSTGRVADENGIVELALTMPENLTGWKIRAWVMGEGTRVGEAATEVVTRKNLLVRMQAPRFFTETDEVLLSANVHNYLSTDKQAQVSLELEGDTLAALDESTRLVTVPAGGEIRVDWRVKAAHPGEAIVTMKALTDEESDAMKQTFPVNMHGLLRTESYTGTIRPNESEETVTFTIPEKRRPGDSIIEVRFSPSLAAAMVDALPYLADYPYGCTEQTLNRFLPTVITQRVLKQMGLDLAAIRDKQTNLNPQELGERQRPTIRGRKPKNPVWDDAEVRDMAASGLARLVEMQSPDGGWGWFPGSGSSNPHITALVVHGLSIGRSNGLEVPSGVIERGVEWLRNRQTQEVQELKNAESKTRPFKSSADNLDAFIWLVLVEKEIVDRDMETFLYRDRQNLSLYAQAMFGLGLERTGSDERLAMILRNLSQFVEVDDENDSAHLRLPNEGYWWFWYGSEIEANAYYLKLLSRTDPKGDLAPKFVKYLLNNRRNATYWNSTRDTAIAIEAMADYLAASGESRPDMTVEVLIDGEKRHEVQITPENLFSFNNALTLFGDAVTTGEHTLTLRKQGSGPLYWNAYVTVFTQEDFIPAAGLEVKVDRKIYKLTRKEDATATRRGSRGQSIAGAIEAYDRHELKNGDALASGDLVEVELVIDSKNDYEYLAFEDLKAAGFEPVDVQSGYQANGMGAYMELRDDRVAFFVERLLRGTHSVKYRLRAEIPGSFSALPAKGFAMYAPELRGNSDELKVQIVDAE